MFGLFKSVADLACDVVKVAVASVEIVADLAGAAVEVAKDVVADGKSLKD